MAPFGFGFGLPYLGLGALPVIGGLVALYTIRAKPRYRKLPSLRLWQAVLAKKRPNSMLGRYRSSVFFVLQLAALALGFLALTDPYRLAGAGGEVLFVLDTSASMAARDGRLAAAKDALAARLRAASPGARAGLVAAGATARLVTPLTTDRGRLRADLAALAAEDGPGASAEELLRLVSASRTPATRRVEVFTDRYRPEDFPAGLPGAELTLRYFGEPGPNVAVTRVDARRTGETYQLTAMIRNFSDQPAEVRVDLDPAAAPDSRRVEVPPGGAERLVVYEGVRPVGGVLGVKTRVARGAGDLLAADDAAYVAPRRGAVRMLVWSADPAPLRRALELSPAVAVDVAPADRAPAAGDLAGYDLVLADGRYDPALAGRPLLLFHPLAATPFSGGGRVAAPAITGVDGTHPVNRYLSLRDVRVAEAARLDRVRGGRVLVDSDRGPLAVALAAASPRRVLVAFPLASTDLPKRIGFPILLTNAVRWLLENDSKLRGQFQVGRPLRFRGAGEIRVTAPGEPAPRRYPADPGGTTALRPFTRAGIHRVRVGGGPELPYPVNLTAPAESDLRPAGRGEARVGSAARDPAGPGGPAALWRLLVVLVLGLMAAEWALLSTRGGAA